MMTHDDVWWRLTPSHHVTKNNRCKKYLYVKGDVLLLAYVLKLSKNLS